jgi:hypothetical protein
MKPTRQARSQLIHSPITSYPGELDVPSFRFWAAEVVGAWDVSTSWDTQGCSPNVHRRAFNLEMAVGCVVSCVNLQPLLPRRDTIARSIAG